MNEIYKWLLFKRLFRGRKKILGEDSKNGEQTTIKNSFCNNAKKKYCSRKMEVEILGEPRIRKTCLSPRSTPILLEINFCSEINNDEKKLSKSIKVEWESTQDEIVTKKYFYLDSQEESNYEKLQNNENELSVAYLGRQNKRVYSERNELMEMKIRACNDEFDSTKVNLSKKSRIEMTNSRHLNLGKNTNDNENYYNNEYEDLVLVEEWLFEK
ncbi:uncharacterized protein cubi_01632 [Cryptosporidium ubiquitum]|uniref:Uncharacterized protein n=1 Tax=Cryptosporidium ubiquitum TaxID=857276 RepID=A0A1J4MEL1_9CRYT|nr:uncharacterized protein cubi_01632 [Cryptosporidium ubiquitum]OII72682.1 hypothetical protein cubi_01632 [Cryptosporidium ubiquitum]